MEYNNEVKCIIRNMQGELCSLGNYKLSYSTFKFPIENLVISDKEVTSENSLKIALGTEELSLDEVDITDEFTISYSGDQFISSITSQLVFLSDGGSIVIKVYFNNESDLLRKASIVGTPKVYVNNTVLFNLTENFPKLTVILKGNLNNVELTSDDIPYMEENTISENAYLLNNSYSCTSFESEKKALSELMSEPLIKFDDSFKSSWLDVLVESDSDISSNASRIQETYIARVSEYIDICNDLRKLENDLKDTTKKRAISREFLEKKANRLSVRLAEKRGSLQDSYSFKDSSKFNELMDLDYTNDSSITEEKLAVFKNNLSSWMDDSLGDVEFIKDGLKERSNITMYEKEFTSIESLSQVVSYIVEESIQPVLDEISNTKDEQVLSNLLIKLSKSCVTLTPLVDDITNRANRLKLPSKVLTPLAILMSSLSSITSNINKS